MSGAGRKLSRRNPQLERSPDSHLFRETHTMWDRLAAIEQRYQELEEEMSRQEVANDYDRLQALAREHSALRRSSQIPNEYRDVWISDLSAGPRHRRGGRRRRVRRPRPGRDRRRTRHASRSSRRSSAARSSRKTRSTTRTSSSRSGPPPAATKPALFAGDLYRMYSRYAERQGWKVEVIDANESDRRRLQGDRLRGPRPGRLQPPQVRERRPPRPARAGDGGAGPHPHLDGDGGRAAGGGRGRRRRSTPRTCASTPTTPAARAARTSRRTTTPSASRTCRPASSPPARTSARSSRTATKAMTVLRSRLLDIEAAQAARGDRLDPARPRSAPATAPRRSAPTTSRRTA